MHKDAMVKCGCFKATMAGKARIVEQLVDPSGKQSRENVEKLKGIVQNVIFCGRQNLPLRAHRNEQFIIQAMRKSVQEN